MPGEGFVIAERYRLDSEFAGGATGRIWLATDVMLQRQVAVKVLRPDYARDPGLLERFRAAARQAGGVSHPGVAKVYYFGQAGPSDSPYVVTELVDGPSLGEVIACELVTAPFVAGITGQVAAALHAAHRCGLVHGDLKPSNVLLGMAMSSERAVKVTDFGIAHAVAAMPTAGKTPGTVHGTGTVLYLAPERVSGDPGTPASDLYSLGVMTFEWLTGAPPFTGTTQQVMAAHLRQPLPPLPASVPAGLARLVTRLTAKDPARRLADAGEVAALARALTRDLARRGCDDALFPAPDLGDVAGKAVTREQRALSATLALAAADDDDPAAADDDLARSGAGLAAHKREIAWAASAIVVAGLIGWAATGPIQTAVKSVHEAIPGQSATERPHGVHAVHPARGARPSRPAPVPGQGGGSTPAGAGRASGGRSGSPGSGRPGAGAAAAPAGPAAVLPAATPAPVPTAGTPGKPGAGSPPSSSRPPASTPAARPSPPRSPTTSPPPAPPSVQPTTPASQPSSAQPTASPGSLPPTLPLPLPTMTIPVPSVMPPVRPPKPNGPGFPVRGPRARSA